MGRLFIRVYYTVNPKVVVLFGYVIYRIVVFGLTEPPVSACSFRHGVGKNISIGSLKERGKRMNGARAKDLDLGFNSNCCDNLTVMYGNTMYCSKHCENLGNIGRSQYDMMDMMKVSMYCGSYYSTHNCWIDIRNANK